MKSQILLFLFISVLWNVKAQEKFKAEISPTVNPWTNLNFYDNPNNFQFALVSDRTGGLRPGIFEDAVKKLNWLLPEFVMSVGDFIPGVTMDEQVMDEQWKEFEGIVADLKVPFFYLPGNHDISNDIMRKKWMDKFGRAYYHYIYKDVLFLALDSNPVAAEIVNKEQIAYFAKVLKENPNVRWTLVFMHHPLWTYGETASGFIEIEKLLEGRPHTVIAGHNHRYLYMERNKANYYILASTGGGSGLRGPQFGEFDHVTWVTMTDEGPSMVNLKLDGILPHDVTTLKDYEITAGLIQSANFKHFVLMNETGGAEKAVVHIEFKNPSPNPLSVYGRFFHDHNLEPAQKDFKLTIPANTNQIFTTTIKETATADWRSKPVLRLDWTMGYEFEAQEDLMLSGTEEILLTPMEMPVIQTVIPTFENTLAVELHKPLQTLQIHYTTDGSVPTANSPVYNEPISVAKTTVVKAKAFDRAFSSATMEKSYTKLSKGEGLTFSYYEGRWRRLPDFASLKPLHTGVINTFNPRSLKMHDNHFAITYQGQIQVDKAGTYTFYTTSDDGSQLFINGKKVVDNDGDHGTMTKSGTIELKKGKHDIRVLYFENIGGEVLKVEWESKDMQRAEISFSKLSH